MSCFSLFIFSSCFSCTDSTSVINLSSISSRYFRTFDLAALSHRSCESVLPLDSASKDVKNSSLLSDTLEEQEYMTETLQKMDENRDENQKLLKQKKSLIIKQISAAKSKVHVLL
jgi:hypothetical protein